MWLLFLESEFFSPELVKSHTSKINAFGTLYVQMLSSYL